MSSFDDSLKSSKARESLSLESSSSIDYERKEKNTPSPFSSPYSPPSASSSTAAIPSKRFGRRIPSEHRILKEGFILDLDTDLSSPSSHISAPPLPPSSVPAPSIPLDKTTNNSISSNTSNPVHPATLPLKSLSLEPLSDLSIDSDTCSETAGENPSSHYNDKHLNLKFSPDTKIFNSKHAKPEAKDATLSRGNLIAEFLRNQKSVLKNISEEELLIKYEQFAREMELKKPIIKESTERITSIRLSEANLRRNSVRISNLKSGKDGEQDRDRKLLNRLTVGRKVLNAPSPPAVSPILMIPEISSNSSQDSEDFDSHQVSLVPISERRKAATLPRPIKKVPPSSKLVLKISTRTDNLKVLDTGIPMCPSFTLDRPLTTLGRDSSNTIPIPTDNCLLSYNHAAIEFRNGSFYLINPLKDEEGLVASSVSPTSVPEATLYVASVRVNKAVNPTQWVLEPGVRFVAGCSVFHVEIRKDGLSPPIPGSSGTSHTSSSPSLSLSILNGQYKGREYHLGPRGATVGRSLDCEITLQDNELSRQHLRILYDNTIGRFYLEDLNSTNGTFIQLTGRYHRRYRLAINDSLLLGRTGFTVNRYDYGISECMGYRSNMEDSWVINQSLAIKPLHFLSLLSPISFYGIFDGHGGSAASMYLSRYLPLNLTHQLLLESSSILYLIEQFLMDSKRTDEENDEDDYEGDEDLFSDSSIAEQDKHFASASFSPPTTSSSSFSSNASSLSRPSLLSLSPSTGFPLSNLPPSSSASRSASHSPSSSSPVVSPGSFTSSPLSSSPPLSPNYLNNKSFSFYTNSLILTELDKIIKNILVKTFLLTDADYLASTTPTHGSTATTVLVMGSRLYCANVGDSRTILCRNFKSMALSSDHKPSRPDEARRITEAGGIIFNNRVMGQLAITRAFGDFSLKRKEGEGVSGSSSASSGFDCDINWPLITAEPEVEALTLTEQDQFVLLACDGLYDVMQNDEVVQFVLDHMRRFKDTEKCCHDLTTEAIKGRHSRDNVSVVLVILNKWY